MNSPKQDTREYHDKLAAYQSRWEKKEKEVIQQRSTIDGFLQNLYREISDEEMAVLQGSLHKSTPQNAVTCQFIIKKHYNKYVNQLIENELDG